MSGNSVKWIPLEGMELTAADLAPAEKLRKFGFSLVCCSFGSGKLTKAGLCIYDVLAEKETPNILVVTSAREIYGWYRILMTGIGADFKVINGAANEIVFFTGDSSNLYLCPPAALDAANGLKTKVPADFQWDLIIVDDEQSLSAPDCRKLSERIPWKSERLLMFTQFPAQNGEERAALSEFVKSTLAEEANASCDDGLDFTVNGVPLGYDTPLLLAGDKHICSGALNVETADYGFDDAFLAGLRRRSDIRTGLPSYKYGGNIFEDYDVEDMKGLYQKSTYTPSDVAELRAVDKKLDCFLNLADKVASDENSRAMIYCCDRNTVDYLRKVLSAMYSESRVKTARSELFSNKDILRKLQVDDSTVYPKFVIAMDDISAVGDGLDRITDVFSYELPDSAVLLERRVTRHGTAHEADRRFVFFRDSNKLFDSRMLGKVLYASLPNAFCGDIPARNVLLDIPARANTSPSWWRTSATRKATQAKSTAATTSSRRSRRTTSCLAPETSPTPAIWRNSRGSSLQRCAGSTALRRTPPPRRSQRRQTSSPGCARQLTERSPRFPPTWWRKYQRALTPTRQHSPSARKLSRVWSRRSSASTSCTAAATTTS
ncbi:MAG: hypothetical protein ACLVFU_03860 [Eggerthellaceae bacterium]